MARCADGARTSRSRPRTCCSTSGRRWSSRCRPTVLDWRSRSTPRSPTRARSCRATSIVMSTVYGAAPTQLTEGSWCDQLPVWSPDGSRLAFLSDRITPGHQLPYTMTADGGEPMLAATLVGSAESVAWSSDGEPPAGPRRRSGLLRARLERTRGQRRRAGRPIRSCAGPGDARRRLFLIDLGCRRRRRGRPAGSKRLGGRLGRRRHRRGGRRRPTTPGSGWYDGVVVAPGSRRAHRAHALRPVWQMEGLALSPDGDPGRDRRGIRERPRPARRQPHADRPRDRRDRRSVARPAVGGPGIVVRRRLALVREHRGHRQRLRPRSGSTAGGRSAGATTRSSATPSPRPPA